VTIFDGATFTPLSSSFAFPQFFTGGVRVSAVTVAGRAQPVLVTLALLDAAEEIDP
jgi:hypothetical protein